LTRYLELGDYLLIAETVLEIPAERLARLDRISLAESALLAPAAEFEGTEAYPDLVDKAAALSWHLVKNHPLPDGNKRAAFLALRVFLERNDAVWNRSLSELLNSRGIRHLTTEPYRPRANGKVERFHQTMAREWAYGLAYRSHRQRNQALPHWLDHYNHRRPHSSINNGPPISRVHNVRG
jgi:prophage maintenance system killer protein